MAPNPRLLRRLVPRTLFGRTLLMLLLPLVIVEIVALQVFYGSPLNIVTRRLSAAIAGEIALEIELLQRYPAPDDQAWLLRAAQERLEMPIQLEPGSLPPGRIGPGLFHLVQRNLITALAERLTYDFSIDWIGNDESVFVRVQLPQAVLDVTVPRKRLYAGTISIFLIWVVGSAVLLLGISALFLRNQVRGMRRLAAAAEAFGLGRDPGPIRPEGAMEVRKAAAAFNLMQERVRRFLSQRTEMLAGVSHDLRTPLTRLRLAIAMLPADDALRQDIADMNEDVDEMDRMIGGYLAFVRGAGEEAVAECDLPTLLTEVASRARRAGAKLDLTVPAELSLHLRPDAIQRAITNLVDNARRHGRHVWLSAERHGTDLVHILVDDDGPGIPPRQREDVFRPFEAGPQGGTGLGLTIARDVVRAHGGEITLETAPTGGLRARIALPIQ